MLATPYDGRQALRLADCALDAALTGWDRRGVGLNASHDPARRHAARRC